MGKSSFRTISEEGEPDYEIWTCPDCGYEQVMVGVGGDVACCPRCEGRDAELDARSKEEFEDNDYWFKKQLKKNR